MIEMTSVMTYIVWEAGDRDNTERRIRAHDREAAAIEYVANKESTQVEFPVAAGGEIEIAVCSDEEQVPSRFRVYGEPVPNYRAEAL